MDKEKELAHLFERMADMLEFLGENHYRVRAYRRVAELLSQLGEDLQELLASGKLRQMHGIGEATLEKIEEYLRTGKIKAYEELKEKVPEELMELLEVPGLGVKTLRLAYDKLKVRSKEEFIQAVRSGRIAFLPGMGDKKVQKLMRGLELWENSKKRMSLIQAYDLGKALLKHFEPLKDLYERAELVGSLRRRKETVGDIDLLLSAKRENWERLHQHFVKSPCEEVLLRGETKSSLLTQEGRQVDLRTVEPEQWGSALQYFTGSKEHNVRLRDMARALGLKLSEYGLFRADTGERIGGREEEEVYRLLGMEWIPPELRENAGEIELAMAGALPRLCLLYTS
ncbi:MAG: helix-hairpin-helix domain-containing protein, partial [Aquificaceae bacterium]|nr:helix-hairpin-helix domain-containing protein [Aquificaceae bacterium]